MPQVPHLRSCYAKVGRLVYFGRMIDKVRLHAAGELPAEYHANLGSGFDGRCCSFLGIDYARLVERVKEVSSDDELLAWCHEVGGARSDEDCLRWNHFARKLGWRDERSAVVGQRVVEYGLTGTAASIETFFDLIDYDEGRDPVAAQAWLS